MDKLGGIPIDEMSGYASSLSAKDGADLRMKLEELVKAPWPESRKVYDEMGIKMMPENDDHLLGRRPVTIFGRPVITVDDFGVKYEFEAQPLSECESVVFGSLDHYIVPVDKEEALKMFVYLAYKAIERKNGLFHG